ncbi:MAG: DUF5711 family protein [Christensenellales bacterium]|jgi:hypothetical protein
MNKLYRPRTPAMGSRPKRRRLNPKILIFALLLVVLAAAVFITLNLLKSSSDTLASGIEMPFTAGQEFFAVSDGIVYVTGAELKCINFKGEEKWSSSIAFTDASTAHSPTLIATWKGSAVQLFDISGNLLFKNDFLGNIQLVRCGVQFVSVLSRDDAGELSLTVLNTTGEKLQELPMTDQNLLDFGFTGELDMLWTLMLDTEGSVPISKIMTYKLESNSIVGMVTINDQIPHKLFFTVDEIYVIGTNHIMLYDYVNTRKSSHLVYGWELAVANAASSPITLAFTPRDDATLDATITTARVIRPGREEASYNLPPSCFKIALGSSKLYAFTPNGMQSNSFDSDSKTFYRFATPIEAAYPVGTTHALIQTLNGLELIALP